MNQVVHALVLAGLGAMMRQLPASPRMLARLASTLPVNQCCTVN